MQLKIAMKELTGSLNLPANCIRPMSSLRPILSKSMTMTSSEHSLIFSQGTLNENASLNTGFRVHLNIGVFRFSILLSPNCSHTLTYGSEIEIISLLFNNYWNYPRLRDDIDSNDNSREKIELPLKNDVENV